MSDTSIKSCHVIISGRVQGVGFRYWTQQKAQQLGLSGWVKNTPDNAVEAFFIGPDNAVQSMLKACHDGPLPAKVTGVKEMPTSDEGVSPDLSGFVIKR